MDFLLNGVTDILNTMSAALPSWSFVHDLASDLNFIKPWFQRANVLFPVDDILTILSLVVGLQIVLTAFYWITRTVNLIRGAG